MQTRSLTTSQLRPWVRSQNTVQRFPNLATLDAYRASIGLPVEQKPVKRVNVRRITRVLARAS